MIKTPSLSRSSAAGAFLHGLSEKSSPAELDLLIGLSDEEKGRLSALDGDLAQDPEKAAEKLRALGGRLASSVEALNRLVDSVQTNNFAELRRLESDANSASAAARLASDSLFREAPLPGVGSDAWRFLWEAARTYSDEVAYPGRIPDEPSSEPAAGRLGSTPQESGLVTGGRNENIRLNSRIVGAMVELSLVRAGGREDGSRAVSGVVLAC